jgi:hypothetical protein
LFSVVNGFVPAINYLKVTPFKETNSLFPNNKEVSETYRTAIGFHLLGQLGLEESRLKHAFGELGQTIVPQASLMDFADRFVKLMYGENKQVSAEDSGPEKARELAGNFRLHVLFRTLAFDILNANDSTDASVEELYRKALTLNTNPTEQFEANFKAFAESAIALIRKATDDVRGNEVYATQIKKLAEFKNRDVRFLDKRTLREWSVDVMNDYVRTGNSSLVQKAIEGAVNAAKLSGNDFATAQMKVTADSDATYIDIKAYTDQQNQHGLFSYPEFAMQGEGTPRFFRVSTDGKKSYATLRATLIKTAVGTYYRLAIPHGSMPVTSETTTVIPLGEKNTKTPIEISAPPLVLNERLGLGKDFTRVPSLMRSRYGVNIDAAPADSKVISTATRARVIRTCSGLFSAL